ncbi:RagB/SusD family nutrient uptake outer membrane protein [Coprobacter fastidiosus]|uniref:RagB/SusD family nutrient uptake outer membrane protein n=1 Tax=Coprobacter fastidiosus TaxID=1099853 RepID=UPI00259314BE|nr:RagB/SusD family nutrient uptake outer membrane protein [Coprobacter fastidiosus]
MKTIKNIFLGSTMLLFTACNFLETTPNDFIDPDDFYKDDTEAFMGLAGIYNTLNSSNVYGEKYYQAVGTDDLTYYYTSSTAEVGLSNNNYTANDANLAAIWQGLYEGINNANYFLERITDAPVTEENKKLYRGEATFLRAYFYFLLAQSWGDVPLITTAQTNTDNYMPNIKATPQATVLKFVTDEMEKVLNDGENYSIGTIQTVGSGRVSRSAVKGILARVYLKRAGWPTNETELYAKAKYWAGEVINPQDGSMTHSLNLQGYDQVFINLASDTYDPAEVIWEVEFKGNRQDSHTNAGRVGSLICGIQNADVLQTSLGYSYGRHCVTPGLWDLYNDLDGDGDPELISTKDESDPLNEKYNRDERKDWNIAPYRFQKRDDATVYWKRNWEYIGDVKLNNNGDPDLKDGNQQFATRTQYIERNAGKFRREYELVTPRDKNYTPINFPLLRYSDVLLMYAEAQNKAEGTPSVESIAYVNEVRTRANAPEVTITDSDDFQRLIEDERGRELCFEGLRKMDLIRWGKYKSAMEKVSLYATDARWSSGRQYLLVYATNGATSDRYQWLPIPTRELGLNNLLQQNQAWR